MSTATTSTPKSKPALFRGDMVRAILSGHKTVTRRPVKPQPPDGLRAGHNWGDGHGKFGVVFCSHDRSGSFEHCDEGREHRACPYGGPGNLLWVRETWAPHPDGDGVVYRATDPGWDDEGTGLRWRPSIYMRRELCRLLLEIEAVTAERVQEITAAEALAEGVGAPYNHEAAAAGADVSGLPEIFFRRWNAMYADGPFAWERNPWVWVVRFRVHRRPEIPRRDA